MTTYREEMLQAADRVAQSDSADVFVLIQLAGLDPRTAFYGGNWSGCDFSHRDLRDCDFRRAILFGANFDGAMIRKEAFEGAEGANLKAAIIHYDNAPILSKTEYRDLIKAASSFAQAMVVYQTMVRGGVEIDFILLNLLMSKAERYSQATEVLRMITAKGWSPNLVTYTTLIQKSENQETACEWGDKLLSSGIQPDTKSLNIWLNKVKGRGRVSKVLSRMFTLGVRPSNWTLNTLLHRMPDYASARAVFSQMESAGVKPDAVSFHTLMNRAPWGAAWAVLNEMQAREIPPNSITYSTLLKKANNIRDIQRVLDAMERGGIPWDVATINLLMSKAETYEAALKYMSFLDGKDRRPDRYSFHALLDQCPTLTQGLEVLRCMLASGLPPDAETAWKLLRHTRIQFDPVVEKPEKVLALTAVLASRSAGESAEWLRLLKGKDTHFPAATVAQVARRIRDLAEAERVTTYLVEHRILLSPEYFGAIYAKLCRTLTAKQILAWHFSQKHRKHESLGYAVAAYLKQGKIDHALRISIACPGFRQSRAVMRAHSEQALALFSTFLEREPFNAILALGYCHLEMDRREDALAMFCKAITLVQHPKAAAEIELRIRELEAFVSR